MQAKDDCWRIDALYKLQPNKVHSKQMQYMKVHHGEVHHKEVHHEEVQLSSCSDTKSDRWEKTTRNSRMSTWRVILKPYAFAMDRGRYDQYRRAT